MPDFFDEPGFVPAARHLLPGIVAEARRRRRRRMAAGSTAAALVLGGGVLAAALTAGAGSGRAGLQLPAGTSPTPAPATSTSPAATTPSATPSSSPSARQPYVDVKLSIAQNGPNVTLNIDVTGLVHQQYQVAHLPGGGQPIPPKYTDINGTSGTWGDGTTGMESNGGERVCRDDTPLISMGPLHLTDEHAYAAPGRYVVTFETGVCDLPVSRSITVTVGPETFAPNVVKLYGACKDTGWEPTQVGFTCSDGHSYGMVDVHWTRWSGVSARGAGTFGYNDCRPDCSRGRFVWIPGTTVILTRPVPDGHGHLVWSRYELDPRPPGYPAGPLPLRTSPS